MAFNSAPKLSVTTQELPQYRFLGIGATDTIFLLGHDDNLAINEPYQVVDIYEALDTLGRDTNSPLTRALLEAYFVGAKDLWVVAVAPMSEYEPDISLRDAAYYQAYHTRLAATYALLEDWDVNQITVPIDAPFNSTVDFYTQLMDYCNKAFDISGEIHLGVMGTRGVIGETAYNALLEDPRAGNGFGRLGKVMSVFVGEGSFQFKELPVGTQGSFAVSAAAMMAQKQASASIINERVPHCVNAVGQPLTSEQINALSEKGFNPVGPDTLGRRGAPYRVVVHTDNTMALSSITNYWSLREIRLVSRVSRIVRSMGKKAIGTIGYPQFKSDVEKYLISLVNSGVIRSYELNFTRHQIDQTHVYVDIVIRPYFSIREIQVPVVVGPQTG